VITDAFNVVAICSPTNQLSNVIRKIHVSALDSICVDDSITMCSPEGLRGENTQGNEWAF
jgi:hypothetical protein